MKILFLINEMGRGGAERVLSYLLNHLPKTSPELVPLLFVLEKSEFAYPIPENIEIVTGSKHHSSNFVKLIKIPLLAFRLKKYIKKNRINSVLSFLNRANYINIIAKYYGSDHQCIISERHTPSCMYKSRSIADMINRILIRILYSSSKEIIAVSNGVKKDLIENFNISEDKVSVIYNPYDIDSIKIKSQEELKQKWLNDPEYKTIITVGNLEKSKNHQLLIKAFKIVSDNISNARLIIIGDGSGRDKLLRLAANFNLNNKIDFKGRLENPFSYVSKADLFVLSSNTEGFPNVLVEAMICGCPVISTDCKSGPNEIITNAHNGYLVSVGDVSSLSSAMLDVLQDDTTKSDIINKAKISVNKFGLSKIVQQYYQMLIKN